MKDPRLAIAVLAFLPLLGPGCTADPGPLPGPPPRFIEYYAGEVFLMEKTRLEGGDSTRLRVRLDSLLRHYSITAAERDSLLAWCRESLPRWEAVLREVMAKVDSTSAGRGAAAVRNRTPEGDERAVSGDRRKTD